MELEFYHVALLVLILLQSLVLLQSWFERAEKLTLEILREKRKKGLWCVADSWGGFMLTVVNERGESIQIRCAFVAPEQITHMVSYRWRDLSTVPENNTQIATNFLNVTQGRGKCWVDSLNHLNDPDLKRQVIAEMGKLYLTRPVVAEYFLYKPTTVKGVFRMLQEATRGWMWQEVTLGEGVQEFGSNSARLCLQLLHLGSLGYEAAKKTDNRHVSAMAAALEACAQWAGKMDRLLAEKEEGWWALRTYYHAAAGGVLTYESLLAVPEEAVAAAAQVVAGRGEHARRLLGAAGTLSNPNIGLPSQWVKADARAASLSVLASSPPFLLLHERQEEREAAVLREVRAELLRAAHAADPRGAALPFSPVPWGEGVGVTDLFGVGVEGVKFVGDAVRESDKKEPKDGRVSEGGEGWVQLRVRGALAPLRFRVRLSHAAPVPAPHDTLHPRPYTLDPRPYTLDPTP